ncbi:MAG: NAD-dependent protein deacylase [Alphaproteobacteria bacterium]|nr:NAD-dependent protein deacylase [Alphaproteobacteria bacterium]
MKYRGVVVLTGAGISKESGLDTFRDRDGLWTKVDLEEVATPEGFARDRAKVQAFHNHLRRELQSSSIQPNAAHHALAALEKEHGGEVLVVTQNVDDLHERAGSRNLVHMHGELFKIRCEACGHVLAWTADIEPRTACPTCGQAGRLRPHVVWFGEMPFDMDRIASALATCDLFISVGTSGNVYPAAGFVAEVRGRAHTVELNLEPSEGFSLFRERHYGPATETVPAFVARLLGGA